MEKKKSLREKYDIPLNYLDFEYVNKSEDARTMERIVHILRSGQEGYFPDLMKAAEDRLRILKPASRFLRVEEPLKRRDCLSAEDWQPIYDWNNSVKEKDNKLTSLKQKEKSSRELLEEPPLPPIRKGGIIKADAKSSAGHTNVKDAAATAEKKPCTSSATDYRKWDRYDPDAEILRMELAVEREREEVESKNRLNMLKSTQQTEEVEMRKAEERKRIQALSEVERQCYADECRFRGNEFFRTKDYEKALEEYDNAIMYEPENISIVYNNRAAAFIQLHKYEEAIADCDNCLQRDPQNVKAWLRRAQSCLELQRLEESHENFEKILALDDKNTLARKQIAQINMQLRERVPATATRLQIEELPIEPKPGAAKSGVKVPSTESKSQQKPSIACQSKNAPKTIKTPAKTVKSEPDMAQLVQPAHIVPPKAFEAAKKAFAKGAQNEQQHQLLPQIQTRAQPSETADLIIPSVSAPRHNKSKLIIEEI